MKPKGINRFGLCMTALILFLPTLSSCSDYSGVGGPLPTLLTEWTEEPSAAVRTAPVDVASPTDAPFSVAPDPSGIGDDIPVSRALVAKMLTLTFNDMNTINALEREITFSDVDPSAWYTKYINAACAQGLMTGTGDLFQPEDPLTLAQAHALLLRLDPAHKPGIVLSDENKDKPVSYALWVELYKKMLEGASGEQSVYEAFGVESAGFIVLTTAENQLTADNGAFTYTGMDMEGYVDKEIRVLHRSREIIALTMLYNETPTLKNAYITGTDAQGVYLFAGGANRYYAYGKGCEPLPVDAFGKICDITVNGGLALSVDVFSETLSGTLLRTTNDYLELKEWGQISLDGAFKTYASVSGGPVKWKNYVNLLVGTDTAVFYMKDGFARAAVITQNAAPETIRVAIGTSGYAGLVHKSVTITSSTGFIVTAGEVEKKYEAGRRFTVSDIENTDLFGQERIYIRSDPPSGKLQIAGLSRNWSGGVSPSYRGVLEIARENGGYSVVNELDMDEYLYAVVPSEMPSSYGVEVSKVQAVTARSYAYNQFFENRFHAYGAHVDDSVSCQVYNNIPENETSIQAVDATRGQCLTYNGSVITANFFSTSCGITANSGEVWANAGVFPAATAAYLKSALQSENLSVGDLRVEENAAAFFKNTTIEAYDSSFSWFRWTVRMTAEEIAASVNANIYDRCQATPTLIKTALPGETIFRSRPVESIGTLTDLKVTQRGEGGNIMELLIAGSEASVLVSTEYNVRMLLRPMQYSEEGRDIPLTRADGSTVDNYNLMPSAFFTFDIETDENGRLTAVTFYGGGNGHGVGMSQNGVKGMIDQGFTFEDALRHFYPGTEVKLP